MELSKPKQLKWIAGRPYSPVRNICIQRGQGHHVTTKESFADELNQK